MKATAQEQWHRADNLDCDLYTEEETIPKDLALKVLVFNSVVDMGAYEDHTIQE